ncbi:MAG: hypothetical protein M3R36_04855 [Bacteroidota bacterium]|nr:hypothetical protein [Bacteroidota bacterium]
MKNQILLSVILFAVSLNCFAGNTMILMQENGGKLIYLDRYIDDERISNTVGRMVDRIAETYVSNSTRVIGSDKYLRIIDLSDRNCTREKLLRNLISETEAGNTIDLYIHGHGSSRGMEFYNGETVNGNSVR